MISTEEIKTGYPSIDKPWSDKYIDKPIRDIAQYDNLYDLLFCGRTNMNKLAISYLEGECCWSLKKLKDKTDGFIRGFTDEGIREGDVVLCGVLATPEFIAAFIALVSIGAIVKLFDIRASENDIISYACNSHCKFAIGFEQIVIPKLNRHVFLLNGTTHQIKNNPQR